MPSKDQVYTTYEKDFNNNTPYESITGSDKGLMNCASGSDTGKPGVNWLYSVERIGWGILGVVGNTRNGVNYTELTPGTGYWSYVPSAQDVGTLKGRDFPDVSLDGDGKWYHVRLCGKPSNGKIVFTAYLDDQTTGEWESNVPAATEIAGIAFCSNTPANTVYIDNFAVKELTADLTADAAVNNVYLTKAVAVNVTNGRESELKDGFALRGQEMKIEFSESVKSTDSIKVYKYNPDTKATTEVEAEVVLGADKKTAAITLSGVEVGDKLTLEIPNTIESASSSNLSRVEATAVAFEITDALPDEIVVTDYRLYKWHEGGNYTSTASSAAAWVPATENDVKNATAADKFNFVAKGYNTGANTQLVMVKALKDPETTLLTDAKTETITVSQYGEFEKAISEGGFGLSGINGSYATYLWKADAFEPIYDKYEFTLNTAASAE